MVFIYSYIKVKTEIIITINVKKVLVFGGNRFVGNALIEKLLDQGYNVDMFNRSGTGPDYVMETCEANIIQGDRNIMEIPIHRNKFDTSAHV